MLPPHKDPRQHAGFFMLDWLQGALVLPSPRPLHGRAQEQLSRAIE